MIKSAPNDLVMKNQKNDEPLTDEEERQDSSRLFRFYLVSLHRRPGWPGLEASSYSLPFHYINSTTLSPHVFSNVSALTHGAIVKNPARVDPEFPTHTIPNIHRDSVIIGVCGVTEDDAAPTDDGWFLSNFFAFNYLMKGIGSLQTWLTSVDPSTLLQTHGEYLPYGNTFSDRKVVLSRRLLEQKEIDGITVTSPDDILKDFLSCARSSTDHARTHNLPLLIFIFGHRRASNHAVNIGNDDQWLEMDHFRERVVATACFSGGWSVNPTLNITTNIAARPKEFGMRLRASEATALIQSMSEMSSSLLENSQTQTETYNEFARTVHRTLVSRVDKFGDHHNIHFSA
jgi:hypothetical protein